MPPARSDFDFGLCSMETDLPPIQYDLHNSQDTTIHFKTILGDKECSVRFIFHPFRRKCNLTYHEYELCCSLPHDTLEETICKQSIIKVAQRLYEICFFKTAGYKLDVLESELKVVPSSKSLDRIKKRKHSDYSEVTASRNVVWTGHPNSSRDGPASNRPKPSFIPYKPHKPISIEDVQDSYKKAISCGKLHSSYLPRLKSVEGPPINPYTLSGNVLGAALLTEEKLCRLRRQLEQITEVPNSTQWVARTKEYKLTPEDLHEILLVTFGRGLAYLEQPTHPSEMSYILIIAEYLLDRAETLKKQAFMSGRAEALARIIGYALMRVCEVVDKLTPFQVGGLMKKFFNCDVDWLKRSRNLACSWAWTMENLPGWQGRELQLYLILLQNSSERALRDFFLPTLPAAAGEFVSCLSSDDFSMEVTISARVPGLVDIVRALLGDHVSNAAICRALGCQESYLDGFEDRFPDSFRFLLLKLDSPSKALALWRPRPDQGAATDDPHSPEVTGEDTPPSNYVFSTQAQGLLEPSGKEKVDGGNGRIVGRGTHPQQSRQSATTHSNPDGTFDDNYISSSPVLDLQMDSTFDGDYFAGLQPSDPVLDLQMDSIFDGDNFISRQAFNPVLDLNADGTYDL